MHPRNKTDWLNILIETDRSLTVKLFWHPSSNEVHDLIFSVFNCVTRINSTQKPVNNTRAVLIHNIEEAKHF
jgi:hypothetical protein